METNRPARLVNSGGAPHNFALPDSSDPFICSIHLVCFVASLAVNLAHHAKSRVEAKGLRDCGDRAGLVEEICNGSSEADVAFDKQALSGQNALIHVYIYI